jgi:hypothetical protein
LDSSGLVDRLWVRHDVARIFHFREQTLRELFGGPA